MARAVHISEEEIHQARKLREDATTAAELRKALSVLLIAELNLDAERAAEILGKGLAAMSKNRENTKSLTNWPWISAILKA